VRRAISILRQAFGVVSVRTVGRPLHTRTNRSPQKSTCMQCRCSIRILCRRIATSSWMNSYLGSRRSMTCRGSQRPVALVPHLSASVPGRNWIDLSCRGPVWVGSWQMRQSNPTGKFSLAPSGKSLI